MTYGGCERRISVPHPNIYLGRIIVQCSSVIYRSDSDLETWDINFVTIL